MTAADGDRRPIRHRRRMHSPPASRCGGENTGDRGPPGGGRRRTLAAGPPRAVAFAEGARRSPRPTPGPSPDARSARRGGSVLDRRRISSAVSSARAAAAPPPDDGPPSIPTAPAIASAGSYRRDTRPDGPGIPTPAPPRREDGRRVPPDDDAVVVSRRPSSSWWPRDDRRRRPRHGDPGGAAPTRRAPSARDPVVPRGMTDAATAISRSRRPGPSDRPRRRPLRRRRTTTRRSPR
jgi:hypothetical protein